MLFGMLIGVAVNIYCFLRLLHFADSDYRRTQHSIFRKYIIAGGYFLSVVLMMGSSLLSYLSLLWRWVWCDVMWPFAMWRGDFKTRGWIDMTHDPFIQHDTFSFRPRRAATWNKWRPQDLLGWMPHNRPLWSTASAVVIPLPLVFSCVLN